MGLFGALASLLAACDDGTKITRVDRRGGFVRSWLVFAAEGGLPVEMHGRPFPGVTDREVAARLRFPPGTLRGFRFRAMAPEETAARRLVLVFNRADAPNALRDCARLGPVPTSEPAEVGFTAQATFCTESHMMATGFLEARKTPADDPKAFTLAMQRLFREMTGVNMH